MLIDDQKVKIVWNNATKGMYAGDKYVFTKYGDKFEVDIKDISPKSKIKIRYICDYCGNESSTYYYAYTYSKKNYDKDCCKYCAGKKNIEMTLKRRQCEAFEDIYKIAKEKGYIIKTTPDEYKNQNTRIIYECPYHGEQNMSAANFRRGYGCPGCSKKIVGKWNILSQEEVISRIESVEGNKLLNPSDYKGNRFINLQVRCKCGNIFYTSIARYNKKFRCKECAKSESKGEYRIRMFLLDNKIDFIPQYKFDDCKDILPLPFDFFLPLYNKCIEFDGEQHFRPAFGEESYKQTVKHDNIKNEYCKNNNINLLRIKYDQFDDIEQILMKELKLCERYSLVS